MSQPISVQDSKFAAELFDDHIYSKLIIKFYYLL